MERPAKRRRRTAPPENVLEELYRLKVSGVPAIFVLLLYLLYPLTAPYGSDLDLVETFAGSQAIRAGFDFYGLKTAAFDLAEDEEQLSRVTFV